MKKVTYRIGLLAAIAGILTFGSCKDDPAPTPEVEQEEFDAARVQFIELNTDGSETTDTTTVNFSKEGVPSPSHTHLHPGDKYRTLITLYYKGNSINHEIVEEGNEHKFFWLQGIQTDIHRFYSSFF